MSPGEREHLFPHSSSHFSRVIAAIESSIFLSRVSLTHPACSIIASKIAGAGGKKVPRGEHRCHRASTSDEQISRDRDFYRRRSRIDLRRRRVSGGRILHRQEVTVRHNGGTILKAFNEKRNNPSALAKLSFSNIREHPACASYFLKRRNCFSILCARLNPLMSSYPSRPGWRRERWEDVRERRGEGRGRGVRRVKFIFV